MITRKELNIPDDQWFELRDNCWVQNSWSASITPKGAFFCEIAAAFDILFDGPGGWAIEPGWWKRKPEEFGDQLEWCEICSAALNSPLQRTDKRDDIVSADMLKRLESIGSPKIRRGHYVLYDNQGNKENIKKDQESREGAWHLLEGNRKNRVSGCNPSLKPRMVEIVYLKEDGSEKKDSFRNRQKSKNNFQNLDFKDWILLSLSGRKLTSIDFQAFTQNIFNPGCLYYLLCNDDNQNQKGKGSQNDIWTQCNLIFLNRRASALRDTISLPLSEKLIELYDPGKVIHLDHYPKFSSNNRWSR
jgi:hypothetical protein